MKRFSILCVALFAVLCFAAQSFAVDAAKARRTPVVVEYEGNDALGSALYAKLQELVNASNPDNPTREARFRILISTNTEFPTRPGVGSVYAVVWTASLTEGAMEYYLIRDVGIVTPDTVEEIAKRIDRRTEGVLARYGYLDRENKK